MLSHHPYLVAEERAYLMPYLDLKEWDLIESLVMFSLLIDGH